MQPKQLFYDLSEYGLLKISGPDAKKFLQGQLTCDLEKITPTFGSLGAHCNPKGRIIDLFYLFQFADAYYLMLPREMVAIALAALKKYAVFFNATLADATDSLVIIGTEENHRVSTAIEINLLSTTRYLLINPDDSLKADIKPFSAWKCRHIKDGIPTIYPETSEKFLPHEINLQALNALNFDKGCYTGQEIIARMHYRGKLKNHMQLIEMISDAPPLLGSDIALKDGLGTLVDACQEAYNKYDALVITEVRP